MLVLNRLCYHFSVKMIVKAVIQMRLKQQESALDLYSITLRKLYTSVRYKGFCFSYYMAEHSLQVLYVNATKIFSGEWLCEQDRLFTFSQPLEDKIRFVFCKYNAVESSP